MSEDRKTVYLVLGPDVIKQRQTLKRFKALLSDAERELNCDEFDAQTLSFESLAACLSRFPLGAPFRQMIIHNAEKLRRPLVDMLQTWIEKQHAGLKILLISSGNFRFQNLKKTILQYGSIIDCSIEKGYKLTDQVIRAARSVFKLTMTRDGAQEIIDRTGSSMELINAALKKIEAVYGREKPITADLVRKTVAKQASSKPWQLSEALVKRDADAALAAYNEREQGQEMLFLWHAARCIRDLIIVKSRLFEGMNAPDAIAALEGPAWKYKLYPRWASQFSSDELREALIALQKVEGALKGSEDANNAFISWIINTCTQQV